MSSAAWLSRSWLSRSSSSFGHGAGAGERRLTWRHALVSAITATWRAVRPARQHTDRGIGRQARHARHGRVGGHRASGAAAAQPTGGPGSARSATRSVAASGDRPAAADQAHRGPHDGEPLLRQLPGHSRARRGVPAGRRRAASRRESGPFRRGGARLPHAVDGAAVRRALPELERRPHSVCRRQDERLRHRQPERATIGRQNGGHGLLDRGGPAVLPRPGPHIPAGRSLVQLVPRPDVPRTGDSCWPELRTG